MVKCLNKFVITFHILLLNLLLNLHLPAHPTVCTPKVSLVHLCPSVHHLPSRFAHAEPRLLVRLVVGFQGFALVLVHLDASMDHLASDADRFQLQLGSAFWSC